MYIRCPALGPERCQTQFFLDISVPIKRNQSGHLQPAEPPVSARADLFGSRSGGDGYGRCSPSLRELRDKLIAGEPYLINGEKNEGQYYDQYMAKNSYWYSRHEMSCIDDETGDLLPGDRRIALIPVGYRVQSGNTQWLFENSICTDIDS